MLLDVHSPSLAWCVYALVDAADIAVFRYIGITKDPARRLSQHRRSNGSARKDRWIAAVLRNGGIVHMVILHPAVSQEDAKIIEVRLISRHRESGVLTNLTSGGDGTVGYRHSPETRKKLGLTHKGRRLSDAHRAEISKSLTGLTSPNKGRVLSQSWRDNIAASSMAAYARDPSIKDRISAAGTNRFSRLGERERVAVDVRNRGPSRTSTSGYKGVSFCQRTRRWVAQIKSGDGRQHLGRFVTAEEAARAYDRAAETAWGSDCFLNFPTFRE